MARLEATSRQGSRHGVMHGAIAGRARRLQRSCLAVLIKGRQCSAGLFGALLLLTLTLTLTAAPALAREAAPAAADPALEARVMRIASELRCLVCQNETIAASNAELAVDLRKQVRELLKQGQNEQQIYDYMTARYGDFVLYRPPVKSTTWLLWYAPPLMVVAGLAALWWMLRRRSRLSEDRFEAEEA